VTLKWRTGLIWFMGVLAAAFAIHAVFAIWIFPERDNLFDPEILGVDLMLAIFVGISRGKRAK
jgi:hypothetical protein